MTKPDFKIKLSEKYRSLNLSKKTLTQFKNFKLLNEAPEIVLSSAQIRSKYKYRGKLEDPDLKEKYYVWHLLLTFDTKWSMIKLETIVKRYYAGSEIINEIYNEA